ncbi:NAD(P)H-dependent glutamate synthase, putative [Plasmodium knowlesi strain H]|uniref:glutamate synthase (NADH) n=3 Tax=Plasmodium knowlesi TaxID=5850 RepID=A0A5K1UU84_PLAKH|nr:glutamate synthase [NADH], putative [Plasmodium knowlesi strain H]OTN66710.1 putative NAD(P)H-dependent glutamate synthase [Plasmodium knowlesi]CAA9986857.1 glutamate synthase [NADH], putative [Plasmodium knowlesi strain H]SBO23703.1 NAD(P)H-dependent glutamate synthase, putative [Plasmodium knowlesi strain H]SBO25338.1 NAD(P)H-dependent glutamate synthase, putative [Plasmodium knowlesi strain H]VVS76331.1 glutamate synthase [NADH], putative [Plasmodium knowlesi strain H]|eukprot:XP_002260659.1 NAD(P)H-dependent glutamate synthase, putative [Plasmodium knowlesi strain H]
MSDERKGEPNCDTPGLTAQYGDNKMKRMTRMKKTKKRKSKEAEHGLYDSRNEKDACGVGVVADINGKSSRSVIQKAMQILLRLSHRGGVQSNNGDGAGILVGIPHDYFQMLSDTCQLPFLLPEKGDYAVAQIFLPHNEERRLFLYHEIEKEVYNNGLVVLGWRSPIPVRSDVISAAVKKSEPFIAQMFVCKRSVFKNYDDFNIYPFSDIDFTDDSQLNLSSLPDDIELLAFFIRKKLVRHNDMYFCSFSSRTIVYKGLLTPSQIYLYFEDLLSEQFTTYLAMVHVRFSTNTSPTWYAAHPFRRICHNGEINTISVNSILFQERMEQSKAPNSFKSVSIKDLRPINEENYIIYDNDDEIIEKKDTFEDIMLTKNRLKKKSRRRLLLRLKRDFTYNSQAIHYKIKREYMNSDINSNSEFLSNVNEGSGSSFEDSEDLSDKDNNATPSKRVKEKNGISHICTKSEKNFGHAVKTQLKHGESRKTKGAISYPSDSSLFDNAIDFLTMAGREIEHAIMMLMPRAYQKDPNITPLEKAFYEYHTCMMEPWDGPALIIFTDGNKVGASLDRNGLRPARYSITNYGLFVLSSETGVVDLAYDKITHKGCVYPGKVVLIDFKEKKFLRHEEVLSKFLKEKPYKKWLDHYSIHLDNIIKPASNMENIRMNAYKYGAILNKESSYGSKDAEEADDMDDGNDEMLIKKLKAFGYTYDAFNMIISPMVKHAADGLGAMGNDTAFPFLSYLRRNLLYYFQQTFAQVTNPAIDPIREENIMSLMSTLGKEGDILHSNYTNCQRIFINGPILNDALYNLLLQLPDFPHVIIDMTVDLSKLETLMSGESTDELKFDVVKSVSSPKRSYHADGNSSYTFKLDDYKTKHSKEDLNKMKIKNNIMSKYLIKFIDSVNTNVENAVRRGSQLIILSHSNINEKRVPIFSILIVGALHKYLLSKNLRTKCSLIVKAGDCFEIHHLAVLLSFGADCIYPFILYESLRFIKYGDNEARLSNQQMISNYRHAANYGILKIMSKNGISTLPSYKGCGLMQPLGISDEILKKCFINVCDSIIGGVTFEFVEKEILKMFYNAYPKRIITLNTKDATEELDDYGEYHFRSIGNTQIHMNHPETISLLQKATRTGNTATYKKYSELQNELINHCEIRGQLEINYKKCPSYNKKKKKNEPINIQLVEPVNKILLRFCTGAMSFGSLSEEAHTTVATAMNNMGLKSNTGEGGEAEDRIRKDSTEVKGPSEPNTNSAVKQIASARFGVTAYSLVNAQELQIKVAQGSKPGEGGELPGYKVSAKIASVRRSTPGVGLISPPPHHDMYSIEDVGQLVYDLKNINKEAKISVKLVSKLGIGVITSGVVKGNCEQILISGMSGGTGASKWTSIKHAGLPWEIGLAEAHQTLCKSKLRKRVILQIDGQLKTGRDVILGALLGAESFSFSTQPLIALGCIMMRKCHLNICPVGICTQDPELRKKFAGKPEYIINFFFMLAEEVREYLASMGFRKFSQIIGRSDLLKKKDHLKYDEKRKLLDFSKLLFPGWKYYAEEEMKDVVKKRYNKNGNEKKRQIGGSSLYSGSTYKAGGSHSPGMKNALDKMRRKQVLINENYNTVQKYDVVKRGDEGGEHTDGMNHAGETCSSVGEYDEEAVADDAEDEKEDREDDDEDENNSEDDEEDEDDEEGEGESDDPEQMPDANDMNDSIHARSVQTRQNKREKSKRKQKALCEEDDMNQEYSKRERSKHNLAINRRNGKKNAMVCTTKMMRKKMNEKKMHSKKKEPKPMAIFCCETQNHKLSDIIDRELIRRSKIALLNCTPVNIKMPIKNTDRAVGAMLSYHIIQKYGEPGLPMDTIKVKFRGTGGLSFGVFLTSGVNFELEGDANDFVGKGLSGGIISVHFPKTSLFINDCQKNMIAGNSVLYGATKGRAFFAGRAGERFAVRNSGAIAVVEGVGCHGCEYMTKGIVVVLGEIGCNFAAGMSGGIAYVLDINRKNVNHQMVDLKVCKTMDEKMTLEKLLHEHYERTNSYTAKILLQDFDANLHRFTKIIPRDIKRVLTEACIEFVKTGNEEAAAILDDWASLLKNVEQPENMYKKAMQFFTTISDDISGLPKTLALRNVDGLIIYDILQDNDSRKLLTVKNYTTELNSTQSSEQLQGQVKKKKTFDFEGFIHNLEICRKNNRKWRRFAEIPFKCNAFAEFKNIFPKRLDEKSKEMIKKYILNEKYLLDLHLKSLNSNSFIDSLIDKDEGDDYMNMTQKQMSPNVYSLKSLFYASEKSDGGNVKDNQHVVRPSEGGGFRGTSTASALSITGASVSSVDPSEEKSGSITTPMIGSVTPTITVPLKGSIPSVPSGSITDPITTAPSKDARTLVNKASITNTQGNYEAETTESVIPNMSQAKPFLAVNPNKVTGFKEYERLSHPLKDISSRVLDYSEIIVPINAKSKLHNQLLKTQASRCVDCGTPTCHYPNSSGGGCPLGNRIFDWNNLIYENEWKKALERLLDTNNFPEITGRVCPAPCEDACVLSINEKPVSIKFIELSIIECGFLKKWIHPIIPHTRTGKKVAIVGSGPAGLTAAQQLNKAGHEVTIFEKDEYLGGLLMNGIPNVRLDKKIVERRLNIMRKEGIIMRNNTNIGKDITLSELAKNFDAILLSTGYKVPRKLDIPGSNLKNIYFAMDFLTTCQKSLMKSDLTDENYIDVSERHVIILGGGKTAVDCISLAIRMGAASVLQFTRQDIPPMTSTEYSWPGVKNVFKVDYSHDEAIIIQGRDPREFCVRSLEFIPSSKDPKRVSGIRAIKVKLKKVAKGEVDKDALLKTPSKKSKDVTLGTSNTSANIARSNGVLSNMESRKNQAKLSKMKEQKNASKYVTAKTSGTATASASATATSSRTSSARTSSHSSSPGTTKDIIQNYQSTKEHKEYVDIPFTERIYKADVVILALGFSKTDDSLWENDSIKIELDNYNCIKTKIRTYQTNYKKIFACGDCRVGPSTVVQAIADGRDVASKIDEFLMNAESALPSCNTYYYYPPNYKSVPFGSAHWG